MNDWLTRRETRQSGFTLLEIMVVVVIISILAAFIVPKIMNRPEQARMVKARQDIMALKNALEMYKLDNGVYPTTDQGLEALSKRPEIPPLPPHWNEDGYVDRLFDDPWGRPYQYLSPGVHDKVDIFSLGPDGEAETEDDIASWKPE